VNPDEAIDYMAMGTPALQGRAAAILRERIEQLAARVAELEEVSHRAQVWADDPAATDAERAIARSILFGVG
jgi:hypothetical protein